ncbi:LysR family transcriptional regulator [Breoghania sp.]|uniref:LysR family transcriptional regulator n=1 Tax=Breoghania sp. TaxID=2065378 RepID=UPI0029CA68E8|nr:LysR family transcriptional regulator [Breoghania sp.]
MNRTRLPQLLVFATVARSGSFRAAARQLGIAPSAVSHAVSALEASLATRLLARTTRSTQLTEEGQRLLARVDEPLAEIEAGFSELIDKERAPAGPLRLTMPALIAEDMIMPRLSAFLNRYPAIELDIRTNDAFEDLVETGCDAGLRLGEHLSPDMIAVRASGPRRGWVVGSPDYLERYGTPTHPRDLAAHRCIRRRFSSGQIYRWELEKDGQELTVSVSGPLILPRQDLIRQAAVDGIGLAFIFEEAAVKDIAAGRLVSVMEDWCAPFDGVYIYTPSRKYMRPALRAFIDFYRVRG